MVDELKLNKTFFAGIALPKSQKDVNKYIEEAQTKITDLQNYLKFDLANKKQQKNRKSHFLQFIKNTLINKRQNITSSVIYKPVLTNESTNLSTSTALERHINMKMNNKLNQPRLQLSRNLKAEHIKIVNMSEDNFKSRKSTIQSFKQSPTVIKKDIVQRSYSKVENGSNLHKFNKSVNKIIHDCDKNAKRLVGTINMKLEKRLNPFTKMIKDAIDVKGIKKKRQEGFFTVINDSVTKLITENRDNLIIKTDALTKVTEMQSFVHRDTLMAKFGMNKKKYIDFKMDRIENDHFKVKRLHRELNNI
jgi:hypothetical protein